MKHIYFFDQINFFHDPRIKDYCAKTPFDPPEFYPELPFVRRINSHNNNYAMIRDLLLRIGMDKKNAGTATWNPFRDLVRPGDKVLIKPNLVTDKHYLGENFLYSTIVHGSVLRPIIDYVYLAMCGEGSIVIADSPLEGADFEKLMHFTGISAMVDALVADGYKGIEVFDLRPRILIEGKEGSFYYEHQQGDPLGYVTIDLGKNSMFAEFDENPDIHYYTLADRTIDHLNPHSLQASVTDSYHNSTCHKYIVAKSVIDADVIINIAKLKTHCKAGATLTLKNMIGMVHQKDCMPHHRPGPPPLGDAFQDYPAWHYVLIRKCYRFLRKSLQVHRFLGFRSFRNALERRKILIGKHIDHGNWKGNDTIWRTILDLNRIALYADKNGIMKDAPQKKFFAIIDGIIGQEGNAPMSGEAIVSSIIFGGFNPVLVDALAIKAMGFDYRQIKYISKAIKKWNLLPEKNIDLSLPDMFVPTLNFKPPLGWD